MDDTDLRLRALEIAAQSRPDDVLAEAERVLVWLAQAPVPASAPKGRRPPGSVAADLPRFVELLTSGMSRGSAAKALGYRFTSQLIYAAKVRGVKLPPPNMGDPRVRSGVERAAAMNAARAARRAAAQATTA